MRFPSALDDGTGTSGTSSTTPESVRFSASRFGQISRTTSDPFSLSDSSGLPVTTILFLKHLERVDVAVETGNASESFIVAGPQGAMAGSDWDRAAASARPGPIESQVVGRRRGARLPSCSRCRRRNRRSPRRARHICMGGHRGLRGLGAALLEDALPLDCPPRGVTSTSFSPQPSHRPTPPGQRSLPFRPLAPRVRVGEEQNDYNRFLMHRVAALFRDVLAVHLEQTGVPTSEILRLLDRERKPQRRRPQPQRAKRSMRRCAMSWRRIPSCRPSVVTAWRSEHASCRRSFPPRTSARSFVGYFHLRSRTGPCPTGCESLWARVARVLVDHGARSLSPPTRPRF